MSVSTLITTSYNCEEPRIALAYKYHCLLAKSKMEIGHSHEKKEILEKTIKNMSSSELVKLIKALNYDIILFKRTMNNSGADDILGEYARKISIEISEDKALLILAKQHLHMKVKSEYSQISMISNHS